MMKVVILSVILGVGLSAASITTKLQDVQQLEDRVGKLEDLMIQTREYLAVIAKAVRVLVHQKVFIVKFLIKLWKSTYLHHIIIYGHTYIIWSYIYIYILPGNWKASKFEFLNFLHLMCNALLSISLLHTLQQRLWKSNGPNYWLLCSGDISIFRKRNFNILLSSMK